MTQGILNQDLIIFPNKLSQRRYEQKIALKKGFCDTSNFLTFEKFINKIFLDYDCSDQFVLKSEKLVIIYQLINKFKKINLKDNSMNLMNKQSCFNVIQKIEKEIANLPRFKSFIFEWIMSHNPNHKLYQSGLLYSLWNDYCSENNLINNVEKNEIILEILSLEKSKWPYFLKNKKKIILRDVLWLEPFQEECIIEMNSKIEIEIQSALPFSYLEFFSDRLGLSVIPEITTKESSSWVEDFCDAISVNDSSICDKSVYEHIDFSCSINAYGEIEDIARRIRWYIEYYNYSFHEIAIYAPSLSLVDDIIPHVFERFDLCYYYDRGRPVLSSPIVKLFFSYLSISVSKNRDEVIDFLRNPILKNNHDILLDFYKKSRPTVDLDENLFINNKEKISGELLLNRLNHLFKDPDSEDDHFNFMSYQKLKEILEELKNDYFSIYDGLEVIKESLKNVNILPKIKRDNGINILTLDEAIGGDYKLVFFAALNEGFFPSLKSEDILFNDIDKNELKSFLSNKLLKLPQMALSNSDVIMEKQRIKFFAAILSTSDQIIFSYRKINSDGTLQQPSSYFSELWNLFGTSENNDLLLSKYNHWRLENSTNSFLNDHIENQKNSNHKDRIPMIGESFLSHVPKGLSYTHQEILINVVSKYNDIDSPVIENEYSKLIKDICIEKDRIEYLSLDNKPPSIFSGHIKDRKIINKINAWIDNKKSFSPTLLEKITYSRFIFLLEEILDVKNEEILDDFTDKRVTGTIIHEMLNKIYIDFRDKDLNIGLDRKWVFCENKIWKLSQNRVSKNCYPVFHLDSTKLDRVLIYLKKEIDNIFNYVISNLEDNIKSQFGEKELWEIEQKKIKENVISLVKFDFESSKGKNIYPFEFEYYFGPKTKTKINIFNLPLNGRIDRIDLCFNNNSLSEIHILDYKSNINKNKQIEEITKAANCQLIIYAFAVQQLLFDDHNKEDMNNITKSSNFPYLGKKPNKNDFRSEKVMIPLNHPNLIDQFMQSLKSNIDMLRNGNFSVDPYYKRFNNYESIIRNNSTELLNN